MYQGTTPTLTFKVPGWDLTDKTVFVSIIDKNGKIITKTIGSPDITYDDETQGEEYSLLICQLTQRETLCLTDGHAECQIRFIDSNGLAYATKKAPVTIEDVIYKVVIAHE